MHLREIQTGYNYNYWANRRILAATARLNPEQYTAPTTHSYGSLRGTLVHLLDAELGWRELCQHGTTAYFDTLTEQTLPKKESKKIKTIKLHRLLMPLSATMRTTG